MNEQHKIESLRFGGYIGVSINGLLVPILIYQLTGSAAFAGFSMFIEWLPKLVFYVMGGRLAARWKPVNAHRLLDIVRILVLCALYFCSIGVLSVYVIGVAAALYQSTNAVSNILFENLVTHWWNEDKRMAGHAMLVKRDVESGLVVLLFGLIVKEPSTLLLIAIGIQFVVTSLVFKWSKHIHIEGEQHVEPVFKTLKRIGHDCSFLPGSGLIPLAVLGLGLGLPAALFYSALPFYLGSANPAFGVPEMIFAFGLVRTVLNIVSLNVLQRFIRTHSNQTLQLIYCGFVVLILGCLSIITQIDYVVVAGALWLAVAGSFCMPWARSRRQELLPADYNVRLSLTGVLIAAEALSYLMAAGILMLFGAHLVLAMCTALFIALVSIGVAYYNKVLPGYRYQT